MIPAYREPSIPWELLKRRDPTDSLNILQRTAEMYARNRQEAANRLVTRRGQDVDVRGQDVVAGTARNRLDYDTEKEKRDIADKDRTYNWNVNKWNYEQERAIAEKYSEYAGDEKTRHLADPYLSKVGAKRIPGRDLPMELGEAASPQGPKYHPEWDEALRNAHEMGEDTTEIEREAEAAGRPEAPPAQPKADQYKMPYTGRRFAIDDVNAPENELIARRQAGWAVASRDVDSAMKNMPPEAQQAWGVIKQGYDPRTMDPMDAIEKIAPLFKYKPAPPGGPYAAPREERGEFDAAAKHVDRLLKQFNYKGSADELKQFNKLSGMLAQGGRLDPVVAGNFAMMAQANRGVLSAGDFEVFWSKAGSLPARTLDAVNRAISGEFGDETRDETGRALRWLASTAQTRMSDLRNSVREGMLGTPYEGWSGWADRTYFGPMGGGFSQQTTPNKLQAAAQLKQAKQQLAATPEDQPQTRAALQAVIEKLSGGQ